jgi:hypothetical protein
MTGIAERLIWACGICMGVCAPASAIAGAPDFDVTLECSADFYAPADSVFAVWTNDTDSTVVAGNHPPYVIYDAGTGEVVCQVAIPWEFHLGPHASVLLDWDQRDCEFNLVPPGRYIMRIWYVFNDSPPGFMVQDRFEVLDPASAPDETPAIPVASWGRLRAMFR